MATGRKVGFHSGTLHAQDVKVKGDLYVQDDIVFSDVSAGVLGVTGGIDMQSTTSAIGIDLGGTFSTSAINIDGTQATAIAIAGTTTTGIDIGTATTGIDFTGTYTGNVIDFTDVTIAPTGSNGPCLIRAGTYGSPVDLGSDTDQSGMIRLYSTTSASGTSYDRGVFACTKTTNTKGVFPIAGLAEVNAIASGDGPNKVQAGQFISHLNDSTAKLATLGGDATAGMYGLWTKITSNTGSTAASGSRAAAIWVDNQMNGTVSGEEYGIFATTGGTKPDAFIGFETTSSGWSNFLYFDETAYDQDPVGSATIDGGTQDKYLKVDVNGTAYGIPLYTSW